MSDGQTYVFKPHERPTMLGSPANPDHPPGRRAAYFAIGILIGLTAGLGNSLVSVNLAFAQGTLGLYSDEATWLTAAYFILHSPSGVSFEVKIACIRALDKDFLPQAAPAVAQTAGSGRIRPRSRCFLAQGRRFSAQRTDLSSRFRSV